MKRKQKNRKPIRDSIPSPLETVEAYKPFLTAGEYDLLLREINQPLAPTLRLNPLKTSSDFLQILSQKYGWKFTALPFCPDGFRVDTSSGPDISNTLEHRLGLYYIQEAASMLPVELFSIDPKEESLALDMAASPGGKTTHLISRMQDRGLVLANDSSQGRIQALRVVLQNWGAVNTAVTRFPGEHFGSWYPNLFDRVLLDAPCSMQGLRTADSHPAKPITEKESRQLALRQSALLASALRAVKPGGEVVYSTCTLLPEENEAVIDALLKSAPGYAEILDAQLVLPLPAPALTTAGERSFSPELEKAVRLWPHRYHTAGFFACHLRKLTSDHESSQPPPYREMEKVGFLQLTAIEEKAFCRRFGEHFGFDLAQDLDVNLRVLVRHFEEIYIFPLPALQRFAGLPLQSAGLLLGIDTPHGFQPSHEWVTRFGIFCRENQIQLDELQTRVWLSGQSLEMPAHPQRNDNPCYIILDYEKHAIGRGKRSGQTLKNLTPRRML